MTDAEFHLDGYNLIRNDRTVKGAGGTAIYFTSKLMTRQRNDMRDGLDIEASLLELSFPNRSKTLICSTYCPDKSS